MNKIGIIGFFLFFCGEVKIWAQADFFIPTQACLQQNIQLVNQSTNTVSYSWDFCEGDLVLTPTASTVATAGSQSIVEDIEVVSDGLNWYGFVVGKSSNSIARLDFGTDLNATPVVNNLGNIESKLFAPTSLKIMSVNNLWYGFVYNSGGNLITRLEFGSSLSNPTVAAQVIVQGSGAPDGGLDVKYSNNSWFILFSGQGGNVRIARLNSINSTPSTNDFQSFAVNGVANVADCRLVNQNGNWYGYFITNNGPLTFQRIAFGGQLFNSSPTIQDITNSILSSYNPYGFDIGFDAGEYQVFITTLSGDILNANLGNDLSATPVSWRQIGNLGILENTLKLRLIHDQSNWVGFSFNYLNSRIYKLSFPNASCGATPAFSTMANPIVSYQVSSQKKIGLRSYNLANEYSEIGKGILIVNNQAPDILIQSADVKCAKTNVTFTPQNTSGNLSAYTWNFGDSNISLQPNPSHIYSSAGIYPVTLQVTASNGCTNIAKSDLAIYNKPTADFSLPAASPLCTNQNYALNNQSAFDAPSNPTWEWRLNGVLVAGTQNLTQAFASTTTQEIRLKAKIPGCENEIVKNVTTLVAGPLVNYTSPTSGCQLTSASFNNTTSGTVTSYSWTFGDGNTSSSTSASNTYANIGSYNVTLQANNAAGCQNSLTKPITIYSKPQPDFSIGLPPFSCAGTASQFTDQTAAPTDSNIATWNWGFGDAANGTSSVKNPSYTYATANTYTVSLAVATNFGCTNSIQKSVTISPSPVSAFSNLPACVNQATQFTDASTGSIKSRLWQIQNNTFSTANPQYTFPASGSFPVVLTVTGNNNCVSQATKNIVVPIVPSLDFSVQAPCANSPSVFTELTTSADPSISKSWSFGSQGTGSGSPVQYAFSSTGTYVVRLNSTRQSGCVYSVSKNVNIVSPPIADFVPSIEAGAAPLPVSFANTSSGASSYLWKFGDQGNSTSVLVSPTFVFSELGSYNVELSAFNSVGCTNRLSKPISVVIPNVDAEMTDFFFVKDPKTGSLQPVVKLLNRSNITLTNPVILLDVAGGSGVSQQITGTVKPNQEISQMLDLKLVPKTNQYVCAEVVVAGDSDTFLNRKCLSLSGEEVLFTPFPNPAREQLNMDWISIDGSAVTFQVLTSAGAVSFQQTISSINPGLNRLIINTSALLPGIYFIRFRDGKTDRTFSFAVTGN